MPPEGMWVRLVLWDALVLEFEGHRSWITDLQDVIKKLPFPVALPILEEWFVPARISRLEKAITQGMDQLLLATTNQSEKLYLIHGRVEVDAATGRSRQVARMRRHYLGIANAKHRKAFTRVLLSNHKMAVEIWQYAKTNIDREDRVCRYGCDEVETPEHI